MDREVKMPCGDLIEETIDDSAAGIAHKYKRCGDREGGGVFYCKHCTDKIAMAKSMELMQEKIKSLEETCNLQMDKRSNALDKSEKLLSKIESLESEIRRLERLDKSL